MEQHTIEQAIAEITEDTTSGAATIAERAADVLVRRASVGQAASPDAFRQEVLATGWALINAQPAIAPIVNLVNAVLWRMESEETPALLHKAVVEAADQFKRQMKNHKLQVAEEAVNLIREQSVIVTLAYSSTVQYALRHAHHAGRHFAVVCAESRVAHEGRDAAEKLASYGVSVRLVSDAAAVAAVADAQLVLLGADMLADNGVISAAGTQAIVLAAQRHHVPAYALCSSKKFLPSGFAVPQQQVFPSEGRWQAETAHIQIRRRVFDRTPLHELTGVVTEQGILPSATIEGWFAATTIHSALTVPFSHEIASY